MQYLVNKTKGVFSGILSPKVGVVKLSPYEAKPVDVEQWDALAFNTVRTQPQRLGLYEQVPKSIAEKRKAYLELTNAEVEKANRENEKLNAKKEQFDKDIAILVSELSKEEDSIKIHEAEIKELTDSLENLRATLTKVQKDSDDAKVVIEEIKATEDKYLKLTQQLDAQKLEFEQAQRTLEKLKNARNEL